jgi:predicted GIY-YIG superfamily endonuclease
MKKKSKVLENKALMLNYLEIQVLKEALVKLDSKNEKTKRVATQLFGRLENLECLDMKNNELMYLDKKEKIHDNLAIKQATEGKREYFLYVLMLREYKFYVGLTVDPKRRLKKHFNGKGAEWTKLYPPVEVTFLNSVGFMTQEEAEEYENKLVVRAMRKYKWKNVRGGYFSNCDEKLTCKALIHHKKNSNFNIDFI